MPKLTLTINHGDLLLFYRKEGERSITYVALHVDSDKHTTDCSPILEVLFHEFMDKSGYEPLERAVDRLNELTKRYLGGVFEFKEFMVTDTDEIIRVEQLEPLPSVHYGISFKESGQDLFCCLEDPRDSESFQRHGGDENVFCWNGTDQDKTNGYKRRYCNGHDGRFGGRAFDNTRSYTRHEMVTESFFYGCDGDVGALHKSYHDETPLVIVYAYEFVLIPAQTTSDD